jgi:hypothetical protein
MTNQSDDGAFAATSVDVVVPTMTGERKVFG